jgi:hypothetical protein
VSSFDEVDVDQLERHTYANNRPVAPELFRRVVEQFDTNIRAAEKQLDLYAEEAAEARREAAEWAAAVDAARAHIKALHTVLLDFISITENPIRDLQARNGQLRATVRQARELLAQEV